MKSKLLQILTDEYNRQKKVIDLAVFKGPITYQNIKDLFTNKKNEHLKEYTDSLISDLVKDGILIRISPGLFKYAG